MVVQKLQAKIYQKAKIFKEVRIMLHLWQKMTLCKTMQVKKENSYQTLANDWRTRILCEYYTWFDK